MLHHDTIEAVRKAARILDFFPGADLKKNGREVKTLCFMHNDSDPSLRIDPRKNRFFCDVCNEGGDTLAVLQLRDGLTFSEAVLNIAEHYKITPQYGDEESAERAAAAAAERKELIETNEKAADKWHHDLIQEGGAEFWEYLDGRGITEAIEDWGIGIGRANTWGRELRLTIPLRDHLGKVIGFVARDVNWIKGRSWGGKWINSPNSAIYDKSRHVFALDRAMRTARRQGEVVIVEGQLDAIACHLVGLDNTVAVGGVGLTHHHVNQITRTTGVNRLVLALDGDKAGQDAMNRMLQDLLPMLVKDQLDLRIATIPDGMDPAEAGAGMVPLVKEAPIWFEWWWNHEVGKVDRSDNGQVQTAHRNIRRLLAALPEGAARAWIQERSRTDLEFRPKVKAKPLIEIKTPEDCYWYGRRALRVCLHDAECAAMAGQLELMDERLQYIQHTVLTCQAMGFDWSKQREWMPSLITKGADQEVREEFMSLWFPIPEVMRSLKSRELEELTICLDHLAAGCTTSHNGSVA